jgi:hypothetical protein
LMLRKNNGPECTRITGQLANLPFSSRCKTGFLYIPGFFTKKNITVVLGKKQTQRLHRELHVHFSVLLEDALANISDFFNISLLHALIVDIISILHETTV